MGTGEASIIHALILGGVDELPNGFVVKGEKEEIVKCIAISLWLLFRQSTGIRILYLVFLMNNLG